MVCTNSWVARYVIAAMLDDDNKAFLITFSQVVCSSNMAVTALFCIPQE